MRQVFGGLLHRAVSWKPPRHVRPTRLSFGNPVGPLPASKHTASQARGSSSPSARILEEGPRVRRRQKKTLEALPAAEVQDRTPTATGHLAEPGQYDRFVTMGGGRPPSANPKLLERVVPRFVLQCRLQFPNALLLTQVGSFYECHFDQAVEVSRLLGIKLTSYRYAGDPYPLAGFPVASLNRHLKVLVNDCGLMVAIANQHVVEGSLTDVDRQVVRIVTPGTLIDEDFIDPYDNRYLLALDYSIADRSRCDLAWLDLTTGSYWSDSVPLRAVKDEIARIAPKEIVKPSSVVEGDPLDSLLRSVAVPSSSIEMSPVRSTLAAPLDVPQVDARYPRPQTSPDASQGPEGRHAGSAVMGAYLARTLVGVAVPKLVPTPVDPSDSVRLDANALHALEIRDVRSEGGAGSLVRTLARTVTRPGRRLLADRLSSPSTDIDLIRRRHDLVSALLNLRTAREDVRDALSRLAHVDYTRVLQKIVLGRGGVEDLHMMVSILETAQRVERILTSLGAAFDFSSVPEAERSQLDSLLEALLAALPPSLPTDARAQLESQGTESSVADAFATTDDSSLLDDPKWLLRPSASPIMLRRHDDYAEARAAAVSTQKALESRFESTIKLRASSKLGAMATLRRSQASRSRIAAANAIVISETRDRLTVLLPEWTAACDALDKARRTIEEEERKVVDSLLRRVVEHHEGVKVVTEVLADLDVGQSFATYGDEAGCVRPMLSDSRETEIVDGRHPVAEAALLQTGDVFLANSTTMKEGDGLLQILTGPNNGGKTTYLRQVATMHVLAQAGGLVPAARAHLGLISACFTRIGASDDMLKGKGTFFLEMEETAKILREADDRALVLLDELGRGTATADGLSISLAVVLHLLVKVRCRTLFATHLHELVELVMRSSSHLADLKLYCTGTDDLAFPVLRPGVNRHSLGLRIAEIAGFPAEVLSQARVVQQDIAQSQEGEE